MRFRSPLVASPYLRTSKESEAGFFLLLLSETELLIRSTSPRVATTSLLALDSLRETDAGGPVTPSRSFEEVWRPTGREFNTFTEPLPPTRSLFSDD